MMPVHFKEIKSYPGSQIRNPPSVFKMYQDYLQTLEEQHNFKGQVPLHRFALTLQQHMSRVIPADDDQTIQ
jgi:hypothetical protein